MNVDVHYVVCCLVNHSLDSGSTQLPVEGASE